MASKPDPFEKAKHVKAISFWLYVLCFCLVFPCSAQLKVQTVSSLQKLTATQPGALEKFQIERANVQAARGEWENFQIVVTAGDDPISNITVSTFGFTSPGAKIASENIHFFWEHFVCVAKPSGNRRLQKLWWPDALIPAELQKDTSLKPRRSRALWANVRVPHDTAPGDYQGTIAITSNGFTSAVPVKLRVHDVQLPAPTIRANVALYYDVLRDWYAKNARVLNDSEFADLKKRYYEFLLDYRLNAYDLPVAWDSEAAQEYLRDPRVLSVRTPPINRTDFDLALRAIRKANAQRKAYYYWIDEPAPEKYDEIKTTTEKLRELGIRHCVTAHPNQSLSGAVDIWCPNIGDFFGLGHLDLKALAAERAKGRETWWYTMVEPRYPYPTWLLDDDAASVRVYGWLMARHGIHGFVYSMVHGWGPNPYENLQSFADTNGDGTLLYPALLLDKNNLGPLPSIRLMLLRDAIEDYELLRPLNEADRNSLSSDLAAFDPFWLNRWLNTWNWENVQRLREGIFFYLSPPDLSGPSVFISNPFFKFKKHSFHQATPPRIDGQLNDAAWNAKTRWKSELRRVADETPPVTTNLWTAYIGENLFVAARCPLMPRAFNGEIRGEWFAVDLAPPEANVRWRFVVTPSGRGIVEKHTREGHFRIEGASWKFAAKATLDFYNIEMQIPLNELELGERFRFNALRRLDDTQLGIKYILRAAPDAGDVTSMPLVHLLTKNVM